MVNGDVLTDLSFAGLLDHHLQSGAAATIAAHRREVWISLGVLGFDDCADPEPAHGVRGAAQLRLRGQHGVYAFSRRVLDFIEPGRRLDFPDLMLRLIDAGETVRARRSSDYWLDIGRHDDYEAAIEEFERLRSRFLPGEPPPG